MVANVNFRIVAAVVVFTLLLGIFTVKLWAPEHKFNNFFIYYTAASLVRSNMSANIYNAVDPETNPQIILADPETVWSQRMNSFGITRFSLYLYPPTLADLMVPLTFLSPSAALLAWNSLGVLMILGLSGALTKVLDVKFLGSTVLVAAAVLLFRPTLNTLYFGQVTILLLFLLTIGFSLYVKGHKNFAALLFVLAIAIKLEPIVIVIPLVAWRDWKCLRSLAVWGILLCLGLWAVNGTDALNLYFLKQLPAMMGGTLGGDDGTIVNNRTLGNIFFTSLAGDDPVVSSSAISWLVRVLSAFILCCAGWLSWVKPGEKASSPRQFEIGMIFVLFACCLAPYSWLYNWALSAPVIVLVCKRAWDGRGDMAETALLTAFLLSLTTSRYNIPAVTPILGVVLGILLLYRIRLEWRPGKAIINFRRSRESC